MLNYYSINKIIIINIESIVNTSVSIIFTSNYTYLMSESGTLSDLLNITHKCMHLNSVRDKNLSLPYPLKRLYSYTINCTLTHF